jgi:hypothetical protein
VNRSVRKKGDWIRFLLFNNGFLSRIHECRISNELMGWQCMKSPADDRLLSCMASPWSRSLPETCGYTLLQEQGAGNNGPQPHPLHLAVSSNHRARLDACRKFRELPVVIRSVREVSSGLRKGRLNQRWPDHVSVCCFRIDHGRPRNARRPSVTRLVY